MLHVRIAKVIDNNNSSLKFWVRQVSLTPQEIKYKNEIEQEGRKKYKPAC